MVAVIDGVLGGLVVGLALNAFGQMAMNGSIVAGLVVGIAIPLVLALRSRSNVRWFLGTYRPRFPSVDDTLYDWSAPIRPNRGKDVGGKPGA
jgi:hypothetical protein